MNLLVGAVSYYTIVKHSKVQGLITIADVVNVCSDAPIGLLLAYARAAVFHKTATKLWLANHDIVHVFSRKPL
jgi:hypothetical protein